MSEVIQIFNPYLPSYEYIPDGEPHVFGERVYLYGSHDRFNGAHFCLNDYVCYSASVSDLKQWRYEGVIYKKEQDPRNQNIPEDAKEPMPAKGIINTDPANLNPKGIHALWAPDVVKGLDGKYYLYYCLDFLPEIGVAVSEHPAGKFEFLGLVKHANGVPLGREKEDFIQFDPGIFIDDDGTIFLYSGNGPRFRGSARANRQSQVMKLEPDMLTLLEEPRKLLPDIYESKGTSFMHHEFFEASSIRKINNKYYFVYSSVHSHELCYAVSDRPDEGYIYGGTLVDIGDVFYEGRSKKYAINCLGNTHGGIENINGTWYVFYHRQTNRTNFCRQACAEKIEIKADGSIDQVPVTSCGLNGGPLEGKGIYPAYICSHLTGKKGIVFSHPLKMKMHYPYITQDISDLEPVIFRMNDGSGSPNSETGTQSNMSDLYMNEVVEPIQYIKNIKDGTVIGYKRFLFENLNRINVCVRGKAKGALNIRCDVKGQVIGSILIETNASSWTEFDGTCTVSDGISSLYFEFVGEGVLDLRRFELI